MTVRGKTFDYSIALDRAGRFGAEAGPPLEVPGDWSPEHLVLAEIGRAHV